MTGAKSAYELSASQVTTPLEVVKLFWSLVHQERPILGKVLDVGAGDCRFALGGNYSHYTGVELDPTRSRNAILPPNSELVFDCAFSYPGHGYDAYIGNPPYVRHHYIENPWKVETAKEIEENLGIVLNKHCNLYLYFLCLGLFRTTQEGLISFIIPFEWVSRPSAAAIRKYVKDHGWNVTVYRFQKPIFDGVLTTASITIIDKKASTGQWTFREITENFKIIEVDGITSVAKKVLDYSERGRIWALRGLSPGTQKVFTLTEGERVHAGLTLDDVIPCVTTMKHLPADLCELTAFSFQRYFVQSGAKCWLIKSNTGNLSKSLLAYLESVPPENRNTYTCNNQEPWYNYAPHPVPQVLISSAFTKFSPKALVNSVNAIAVGSVMGVHSNRRLPKRRLQSYLRSFNFERKVVGHARVLKKIEVKQMNTVLNKFQIE